MVLRLANADIVPYDYVEYARTMRRYLPALDRAAQAKRLDAPTAPLAAAIDSFERAARTFADARDRRLATNAPPRATLERSNAALRRVERALTRPEGLRTRPWFRNLIYAADENNGYANVVLPSVSEAIRSGDADLVRREVTDLSTRFHDAARALADAELALR
jgi:N-acetylated-alpha-linked acidic dipeptidase